MSLSPTIFVPLLTNNNKTFKVRTLMDPGSGTNWIVVSLLKHVKHAVKGSEMLEVVTFSGTIKKNVHLWSYCMSSQMASQPTSYAMLTTHLLVTLLPKAWWTM